MTGRVFWKVTSTFSTRVLVLVFALFVDACLMNISLIARYYFHWFTLLLLSSWHFRGPLVYWGTSFTLWIFMIPWFALACGHDHLSSTLTSHLKETFLVTVTRAAISFVLWCHDFKQECLSSGRSKIFQRVAQTPEGGGGNILFDHFFSRKLHGNEGNFSRGRTSIGTHRSATAFI